MGHPVEGKQGIGKHHQCQAEKKGMPYGMLLGLVRIGLHELFLEPVIRGLQRTIPGVDCPGVMTIAFCPILLIAISTSDSYHSRVSLG
jgi:hypothetical protein